MIVLTWLLTTLLIIDCLFLILLVLVQLPKKEAGAGIAFGGAATDALFGAGTGNVLTKITKYCAAIFLALCLVLSLLISRRAGLSGKGIDRLLKTVPGSAAATLPPVGSTNLLASPTNSLMSTGLISTTNILGTNTLLSRPTNTIQTPLPLEQN